MTRGAYVLDEDANEGVYVNDERRKFESDSGISFPVIRKEYRERALSQVQQDRMNRTEASVRGASQGGGSSAASVQDAPGADDGRFGFGAFAARYQLEKFQW